LERGTVTSAARGVVINVHEHGATVRLEDGTLAAVPAAELATNRPAFVASRERRSALDFAVDRSGRHAIALLARDRPAAAPPAPSLVDPLFEERIGAYLKSTEAWAPTDRPVPAERHFIRKKRRAAFFEARTKST
jgi:hypothetical protein